MFLEKAFIIQKNFVQIMFNKIAFRNYFDSNLANMNYN